jgi:ABC-type glycerol-3-phosphate transport system substrate-binding protein
MLMSVIPGSCDRKVLDAAGVKKPPTTWDELLALGPVFKKQGAYVTTLVVSSGSTLNTTFYPWMWQAGGAAFGEDGSPSLDSEAGREALGFMVKLVEQGFVPKEEISLNLPAEQTVIGKRKVACTYHFDPVIMKDYWGDDLVVAPPLKNKAEKAYGTVGSYTLMKSAKDKEAAAEWINFVTTPEVMGAFNSANGYLPPKADAPVTFPEGSIEAETGKYIELADVGPRTPGAREVQGVVAPQLQAAVLGDKSPAEALKAAQSAAESQVKR